MDDDKTLIRAYLQGDETAFETLYYRYRLPLYNYLCGILPECEAEDIFQQTWINVCRSLPGYHDEGKFQAWLFRIGRNLAWDHVRGKHQECEFKDSGFLCEEVPPPEDLQADREFRALIDKALASLPEKQKVVFLMRQDGLSFKEIAGEQSCKVNTVIKSMWRAVEKIRKFIQRFEGEFL